MKARKGAFGSREKRSNEKRGRGVKRKVTANKIKKIKKKKASSSLLLFSILLLLLLLLLLRYLATIASLCRTKSSPSPLHSSSFFGAETFESSEETLAFSFLAATAALWRETSSECVVT